MAHSILVVDDDPHIRDVVRFAFEKTGMTISIAQDGKEALARFDRNVHDLIVLDIGMPEMDGLEVCRQIRKTSDTPILFLSARDSDCPITRSVQGCFSLACGWASTWRSSAETSSP